MKITNVLNAFGLYTGEQMDRQHTVLGKRFTDEWHERKRVQERLLEIRKIAIDIAKKYRDEEAMEEHLPFTLDKNL